MSEAAPTLTMPGYLPRIVGREVEDALRRRGGGSSSKACGVASRPHHRPRPLTCFDNWPIQRGFLVY